MPIQSVASEEYLEKACGLARVFRSFRNTDFLLLWGGNFLSNVGSWMQTVALGWLVLDITNSAWLLGVNGFVAAAPTLLFSLISGAFVDRLDRCRLMLVMQFGMLTLALLLGTLTLFNRIDLQSILIISFLSGLAMAVNYPAFQALYPGLVSEEDLLNAVALNSAQFNIARAVGPTLAGLMLGAVGAAACFYLNATSFLGLIVALLIIRPPQTVSQKGSSVWQAMREGFIFVRGRKSILLLLSVSGFLSLFGLPFIILMPVFARDLLGVGASGLGYLMGGAGLGASLCAIVMAYIGKPQNKTRTTIASAITLSLALVLFSMSRNYWLSFLLLIVLGAALVGTLVVIASNIQLLTPSRMRGRVMSMYNFSLLGMAPLGSLQAGAVAENFGARIALGYGGVLCLVYFSGLFFVLPKVWREEDDEIPREP